MGFDKGVEFLPVGDLLSTRRSLSLLGLDIPSFSFAVQPQVNRIAADMKQLAALTFRESIHLSRMKDFAPQVVAVGFSYERRSLHRFPPVYVPNSVAVAILCQFNENQTQIIF